MKIGNFLEVGECIDCLQGRGPKDKVDLSCRLAGWMLSLGGVVSDPAEGEALARKKLADGSAWERFLRNVEFQGGDVRCVEDPREGTACARREARPCRPQGLRQSDRCVRDRCRLRDPRRGAIAKGGYGAPRRRHHARTQGRGPVDRGDELCLVHAETEDKAAQACALAGSAFQLGESQPSPAPLIIEEITTA